jgi:hypothetical protein
MIDYFKFETEVPYSLVWNRLEIEIISRAFQLKRLSLVSRGKQRNRIRIASPGENRTSQPNELADGLLEWAITYRAFETYRSLRPLQDGMEGIFAIYLYPDPLLSISSHSLREVGSILGEQLGYAIAVWNELGANWPDLWDYYASDSTKNAARRDIPFLNFFRMIQLARLSWQPNDSYAAMTECVLKQILNDFAKSDENSSSKRFDLLLGAGISSTKIGKIQKQVASWASSDEIMFLLAEHDQAYAEQLQVEDTNWTTIGAKLSDSLLDLQNWNAAGKLLDSRQYIREQNEFVSKILKMYAVKIDVSTSTASRTKFDIRLQDSKDDLIATPVISLRYDRNKQARYVSLVLSHEVGHLVYNASWMTELRLVDLAVKYLSQRNIGIATSLALLKQEMYHKLIQSHSAIETIADEFACHILIPQRVREIMQDFCNTSQGFNGGNFMGLCLEMLGISPSEMSLTSRFVPIITDMMPNPLAHSPVAHGEELRKIRHLVSTKRVQRLLDSFWSEAAIVISNPQYLKQTRLKKNTNESSKQELYFEGIVCE